MKRQRRNRLQRHKPARRANTCKESRRACTRSATLWCKPGQEPRDAPKPGPVGCHSPGRSRAKTRAERKAGRSGPSRSTPQGASQSWTLLALLSSATHCWKRWSSHWVNIPATTKRGACKRAAKHRTLDGVADHRHPWVGIDPWSGRASAARDAQRYKV